MWLKEYVIHFRISLVKISDFSSPKSILFNPDFIYNGRNGCSFVFRAIISINFTFRLRKNIECFSMCIYFYLIDENHYSYENIRCARVWTAVREFGPRRRVEGFRVRRVGFKAFKVMSQPININSNDFPFTPFAYCSQITGSGRGSFNVMPSKWVYLTRSPIRRMSLIWKARNAPLTICFHTNNKNIYRTFWTRSSIKEKYR